MLKTIFEVLGSGQAPYNTLLYFQYQLLLKAGLASQELSCEQCGTPIDSSSPAYATLEEWSFICPDCMNKTALKKYFQLLPAHREILENWNDELCLENGLTRFFNRIDVSGLQNFLNYIYRNDFVLKSLSPFMELLQQKSDKKT